MKSYQQIYDIQKEIFSMVRREPEKAFTYFRDQWNKLTYEEKRITSAQIINFCSGIVNTSREHTWNTKITLSQNHELQQICCSEIYNCIEDEFQGKLEFGNLKLGPGIKQNDIAAVFKILYDLKYIDNTLSNIEHVIIRVFNFADNSTIGSYLNDNSKIKDAAIEFKKRIVSSSLAREEHKS